MSSWRESIKYSEKESFFTNCFACQILNKAIASRPGLIMLKALILLVLNFGQGLGYGFIPGYSCGIRTPISFSELVPTQGEKSTCVFVKDDESFKEYYQSQPSEYVLCTHCSVSNLKYHWQRLWMDSGQLVQGLVEVESWPSPGLVSKPRSKLKATSAAWTRRRSRWPATLNYVLVLYCIDSLTAVTFYIHLWRMATLVNLDRMSQLMWGWFNSSSIQKQKLQGC